MRNASDARPHIRFVYSFREAGALGAFINLAGPKQAALISAVADVCLSPRERSGMQAEGYGTLVDSSWRR